jgi:hypothetical protein
MNREDDQFIGGQFVWFTGVVEDINDEDNLGRVKVRCFGFHTDDKGIIPTEDLPWATVMGPTTSAGVQGIGTTHRLLSGSWVVGFFRDGPSAQDPLVMGSIASQTLELPDKTKGFSGVYPTEEGLDMPLRAQFLSTETQVIHTPSGHQIELYDGEGEEEIIITHRSGSTLTFNSDGTIALDSFNDVITLDGNTSITGTLSVSGAQTNQSSIVADGDVTALNAGEDGAAAAPVTLGTHIHIEQGDGLDVGPPKAPAGT